MLLHKQGLNFEETKATILLNKYAEALSGKTKNKDTSDTLDIKKFKRIYGSKIKTKEKL